MLTRLAETHAAHQHSADVKFAIDEMIRFVRWDSPVPESSFNAASSECGAVIQGPVAM
jgi:hypothetical protein